MFPETSKNLLVHFFFTSTELFYFWSSILESARRPRANQHPTTRPRHVCA